MGYTNVHEKIKFLGFFYASDYCFKQRNSFKLLAYLRVRFPCPALGMPQGLAKNAERHAISYLKGLLPFTAELNVFDNSF